MLLGLILGERSIWGAGVAAADLLRLPDKVLEQVALVFGEEQDFGLLDNAADVGDELATLLGELARGRRQRLRGEEAVHCHIDLLVLIGPLALALIGKNAPVSRRNARMELCHWQKLEAKS